MLVLTRKFGEEIVIDPGPHEIVVKVVGLKNGGTRLGITAPDHIVILRRELMTGEGSIVNNNGNI